MNIIRQKIECEREIKNLGMSNLIVIKSGLTGLFFATIIMLLPTLFFVNLLIFYEYVVLISCMIAVCVLGWLFLVFLFASKALIVYEPRIQDCRLMFSIITDYIIVAAILITAALIYFGFFFRI